MEIQEEIADQIQHWTEAMPERIKTLIGLATADLFSGPIYLSPEGSLCVAFDDGATAFNFESACTEISTWLEGIEDVLLTQFVPGAESGDEEIEYDEPIEGSATLIRQRIVGSELFNYLH